MNECVINLNKREVETLLEVMKEIESDYEDRNKEETDLEIKDWYAEVFDLFCRIRRQIKVYEHQLQKGGKLNDIARVYDKIAVAMP